MKRFRWFLTSVPLLVLLTACSTQASVPHVATLPTTAAASGSSSRAGSATTSAVPTERAGDPASHRPQLRVDDSDARVAALVDAWRSCLLEHGARRAGGNDLAPAASAHRIGILIHEPIPASAKAACLDQEPLQPRALNVATNPRFHEQSLQWIACLQKRGLWYTLVDDKDLTATYTPGHAVPDGLDVGAAEAACTSSVFGGQ